jgi:hypothetical protein
MQPHEEAEVVKYATSMLPHYLVHSTLDDLQFLLDHHPAFRSGNGDERTSGSANRGIFRAVRKQLSELCSLLNLHARSRVPDLPSEFNRSAWAPPMSRDRNSEPFLPHNALSISLATFLAQLHLHSQLWHVEIEADGLPSAVGPVLCVPFHFRERIGKDYSANVGFPDWMPWFPLVLQRTAADLLGWSISRYPVSSGNEAGREKLLEVASIKVAEDWLSKAGLTFNLAVPLHLATRFIESEEEDDEPAGPGVFLKPRIPQIRGLPGPVRTFVPLIQMTSKGALRLSSEERYITSPAKRTRASVKSVPSLVSLAAGAIASELPRLGLASLYSDPPARLAQVSELLQLCPSHLLEMIWASED